MLQLRQSGPHLERVSIPTEEGCRIGSLGVKKLDSDVMIASVALGVDPKDAQPTQCMVVKVALHGTHGIRTLHALLDTGAQGNFLSQSVAVEEGFRANSSSKGAVAADGHPIVVYGQHTIRTEITDSLDECRISDIEFIATDIKRYDAILGWPWIYQEDPDCQFRTGTWKYRESNTVHEIDATEMFELERLGAPIYAVFVTPAIPMRSECVALHALDTEEIQLPPEYQEYAEVFSETEAAKFPDSTRVEHSIPVEEGAEVPYGPIYSLSANELRVLREYIESSLAKGWIRPSESPAGAPILFVPKKDGGLRLCVDYRGLNRVTIRNRHPLPLISETLDRLSGAKRFTRLDLRDAYHRIRIKRGDEWKTVFRTRYSHFEYMAV